MSSNTCNWNCSFVYLCMHIFLCFLYFGYLLCCCNFSLIFYTVFIMHFKFQIQFSSFINILYWVFRSLLLLVLLLIQRICFEMWHCMTNGRVDDASVYWLNNVLCFIYFWSQFAEFDRVRQLRCYMDNCIIDATLLIYAKLSQNVWNENI